MKPLTTLLSFALLSADAGPVFRYVHYDEWMQQYRHATRGARRRHDVRSVHLLLVLLLSAFLDVHGTRLPSRCNAR